MLDAVVADCRCATIVLRSDPVIRLLLATVTNIEQDSGGRRRGGPARLLLALEQCGLELGERGGVLLAVEKRESAAEVRHGGEGKNANGCLLGRIGGRVRRSQGQDALGQHSITISFYKVITK